MTKHIATALLIALMVIAPAAVAAQETPAPSAMCAPTTLDDLFPPIVEETPTPTVGIGRPGQPPVTAPEPAEVPDPEPVAADPNCRPFIYEMGSPVGSAPGVISGFGADRPGGRKHKGADVIGPKLMPVYAVSDGVVSWMGSECCSLALRHPDGWSSYYIHLNNDTFGTDDGLGWGLAPGIELGSAVKRGDLIGWNGDSGNAEQTVAHIHFELRMPDGRAVDAVPSLNASQTAEAAYAFASADAAPVVINFGSENRFRQPYADDDGNPFEAAIGELTSLGLLTGCGVPLGAVFCPDASVFGADVEAFAEAAYGTTIDTGAVLKYEPLLDDRSLTRMATIFDCGVGRYCENYPLSNGELEQLFAELGQLTPLRQTSTAIVRQSCGTLIEVEPAVTSELTRASFAGAAAELLSANTAAECVDAD